MEITSRSRFLRTAIGGSSVALLGALVLGSMSCKPTVRARFVAGGFAAPTHLAAPIGDARRFVTERAGTVRIIDANGAVEPTPFLDITSRVSTVGEGGLLSIAFPADYEETGHFYLFFADPEGDITISRFLRRADDPDLADPTTEKVLLSVDPSGTGHKGGTIAFSPADGYLYAAFGDGGVDGRAQDTSSLLGKMIRLDVSGGPASDYTIPPTNPFVGGGAPLDEIWSIGFRNPFRFGIDRLTGDVWIGDVGLHTLEEVDHEPAGTGGRNYGWRIHEGTSCYTPSAQQPCEDPENPLTFTFPVYEYTHADGCSITGGNVYRGSVPFLRGTYLFADFCSERIWQLVNGRRVELTNQLTPTQGVISGITALGEDGFGEMYIVSLLSGNIHRISD